MNQNSIKKLSAIFLIIIIAFLSNCKKTQQEYQDEFLNKYDYDLFTYEGFSPVIEKSDMEAFDDFIRAGGDVELSDHSRSTLLMLASRKRNLIMLKALIKAGADINYENKYKNTALAFACDVGFDDIVKELIKSGANVNQESSMGNIAFLSLVYKKRYSEEFEPQRVRIAKILIDNGLNINALFKKNKSILHYSIETGHIGLAKLLIESGADVNLKSKSSGETPLKKATEKNQDGIIKLLIKYGAKEEKKSNILIRDL